MSLAELVHAAQLQNANTSGHNHDNTEVAKEEEPPSARSNPDPSPSAYKYQQTPPTSGRRPSIPDSPSLRTGPPRSISYNYSLPQSPVSRQNSIHANGDIAEAGPGEEEADFMPSFQRGQSEFRGAFELNIPEQREREREAADKKGKKRESKLVEDSWNPIKWFHESPSVEKTGFDFGQTIKDVLPTSRSDTRNQTLDDTAPSRDKSQSNIVRSQSLPHRKPDKPEKTTRGPAKWGRLRSLLPTIAGQNKSLPGGQTAITPQNVNIADELLVGGLSTMMLRLWFERDEKERRRIPILFHRLRIRVSDSLHPMHGSKAVFRIECEYANGAARWVVYRQLRDFLSLHTHYTVSNAYNRNIEAMPQFPRTSQYSSAYILMCLP